MAIGFSICRVSSTLSKRHHNVRKLLRISFVENTFNVINPRHCCLGNGAWENLSCRYGCSPEMLLQEIRLGMLYVKDKANKSRVAAAALNFHFEM